MNKHDVEHMLEHWIEHNESHSRSFRERASQVQEISAEAAADINQAAEMMDRSTELLKKALQDLNA